MRSTQSLRSIRLPFWSYHYSFVTITHRRPIRFGSSICWKQVLAMYTHFKKIAVASLAFLSPVFAHTRFTSLFVDGTNQGDAVCVRKFHHFNTPPPSCDLGGRNLANYRCRQACPWTSTTRWTPSIRSLAPTWLAVRIVRAHLAMPI